MVLRGAQVFTGRGFSRMDLLIDHGVIADIAPSVPFSAGAVSVDLSSLYIFPGLVDVHVHLREPGFSYKETMESGTLAAAHGGFTAVCAMPNLSPVPDDADHLQAEINRIAQSARVRVYPYGAITREEKGEALSDMEAMAPRVVAFSDDGKGVQNDDMMRAAMKKARALGRIIAAHCEDNSLLRGGYIHDGAYAAAHGHRGISSESEWRQIERDLRLAAETGCAYHVCHISCRESVKLIRIAKAAGVDVSCETAPHYLTLDDSRLQEDGRFKMNPPLRSPADREALIEGLLDGTIDMIATDHAPHSAEEKSRGLEKSAMGIVGLETAFPKLYTELVRSGILPLERLIELMHGAPMRRFGVGAALTAGQRADLTVFDLDNAWRIDPADFLSMGRSTPFAGDTVYGRCRLTVVGGRVVWNENIPELTVGSAD